MPKFHGVLEILRMPPRSVMHRGFLWRILAAGGIVHPMSRKSPAKKKKKTPAPGAKPAPPAVHATAPAAHPTPLAATPPSEKAPPPPREKRAPTRDEPVSSAHVLPAAGLVLLVLAAFGTFLHYFPRGFWKETPGKITRVEVEETTTRAKVWDRQHGRYTLGDVPAWTPRVYYSYVVGGETYTSSGPPADFKPSVERQDAEAYTRKLGTGDITVFHRRERPARSTLIPPASFLDAVLVIGAIFVVLLLVVLSSRHRPRS